MNDELARLVRKGRASSFRFEVEQILERDGSPSLEGATFQKVDLQGFDFEGIDLTNVEFDRCSFNDVRFVGCNVEGTYINSTEFTDCVVTGCTGEGFSIDACTMTRTELSNMELPTIEWTDTQMLDCALNNLTLAEGVLERVTLRGGSFASLSISEGTLSHVTIRDVDPGDAISLEECSVSHSYLVHPSAALPTGFARKSGRRRTM